MAGGDAFGTEAAIRGYNKAEVPGRDVRRNIGWPRHTRTRAGGDACQRTACRFISWPRRRRRSPRWRAPFVWRSPTQPVRRAPTFLTRAGRRSARATRAHTRRALASCLPECSSFGPGHRFFAPGFYFAIPPLSRTRAWLSRRTSAALPSIPLFFLWRKSASLQSIPAGLFWRPLV